MSRLAIASIAGALITLAAAGLYTPVFIYRHQQWNEACRLAGGDIQDLKYGKICWSEDGRRIRIPS